MVRFDAIVCSDGPDVPLSRGLAAFKASGYGEGSGSLPSDAAPCWMAATS